MKKLNPVIAFLLLFIPSFESCRGERTDPAAIISEYFEPVSVQDTIHIGADNYQNGRLSIPIAQFYQALDSTLLNQMIYYPDSESISVYGHWTLSLDERFDAQLLEIQQSWFNFKYLLLYSKETHRFTGLFPAACFYGGEGGQIRMESWLTDVDDNVAPHLLTRRSEHSIFPGATAAEEMDDESVARWQWRQGNFMEVPVHDSSRWIRAYPLY